MPELPEVETTVRGLRRPLLGAKIVRTRVLKPDVLRVSARSFRCALAGRTVTEVGRRAKNILIELDGGSRLVVNLGMTGRVILSKQPGSLPFSTHPAVRFSLEDRRSLVYDDVRRFGGLEVLSAAAWEERDARLGPEPLLPGFTAELLHEGLGASTSPVRSWLLDQRRIAGVGNIYAIEALFRAGVLPSRLSNSISREEACRLHRAIRKVLRDAIDRRGTTLRDYRDVDGEPGGNAPSLLAYGRAGEPCPRCGDSIQRVVFGNRSAFLCSSCQR
jgi:formamidopyrimidine-DNA glycosylase